MSPPEKQFTVYDLVVLSALLGTLGYGWVSGIVGTEAAALSLIGIISLMLAYATLSRSMAALMGPSRATRKMLHIVGGSFLVMGLILFPRDIPFLSLALLLTYLVHEAFRWLAPKKKLWMSSMLEFFGSSEETFGRPFWEAMLGLAAACAIMYTSETVVALVALVNLTFGDGIAGLVREGMGEETRSFGAWKGWVGSIVGTIASALITLAISGNIVLLIPIIAGMVVERLPIPVDDNLSVPISTAIVARISLELATRQPT